MDKNLELIKKLNVELQKTAGWFTVISMVLFVVTLAEIVWARRSMFTAFLTP